MTLIPVVGKQRQVDLYRDPVWSTERIPKWPRNYIQLYRGTWSPKKKKIKKKGGM